MSEKALAEFPLLKWVTNFPDTLPTLFYLLTFISVFKTLGKLKTLIPHNTAKLPAEMFDNFKLGKMSRGEQWSRFRPRGWRRVSVSTHKVTSIFPQVFQSYKYLSKLSLISFFCLSRSRLRALNGCYENKFSLICKYATVLWRKGEDFSVKDFSFNRGCYILLGSPEKQPPFSSH